MKRSVFVLFVLCSIVAATGAARGEVGICRSAGFWSLHGGTEKNGSENITQAVLDAGGPVFVCGFPIDNTLVGDPYSALEAMCVSPAGDSRLQLIRQLAATGLNCLVSGLDAYCTGSAIADLFSTCNSACLYGGDAFLIEDCISQLSCVSEGGFMALDAAGMTFCASGYCADLSPCSDTTGCAVGECSPSPGCHEADLCPDAFDDGELNDSDFCFEPLGAAGSSKACWEARKNGEINHPPIADAGPDQSVIVGDTSQLDGSGSYDVDGDPLTYGWSFVSMPPGSAAALDDPMSVSPSFSVDVAGDYVLQLVVNDGELDSAPDTVVVSTLNTAPVADAGPDQTVVVSETVHLDGSGSTDVDGDDLGYSWSWLSRPADSAAELDDSTAVKPTFVVDVRETHVVQLIVNDGLVDSDPDTVTIGVDNSPPVAHAGEDQSVYVGDAVELDGGGSTDVDGDELSFDWSLITVPESSAAELDDPTAVRPAFDVDLPGVYVAQLVVDDGLALSSPDTVSVTTLNSPPVADAGPDHTVFVGDVVALDGSGSHDVDLDPLSFTWSLVEVPDGSAATLDDPSSEMPTFQVDLPGVYVVQLIVNDGELDSVPDTASVTTQNSAPEAEAGPDQIVDVGDTVLLDGSGSSDADLDCLTYCWSLIVRPSGSTAVLDDPTAIAPSFVPDLEGTYVAQLIVNDGTMDSAPDTAVLEAEFVLSLSLSPEILESLTLLEHEMTVSIDQSAGAGGFEVTLSSSDPSIVSVPDSVVIPEGETSVVFTVKAETAGGTATITAEAPDASPGTATVEVAQRTMTIALVEEGLVGIGRTAMLRITLDDPSKPGGVTVTVTSDNTAILGVTPPGTAFIDAGETTGLAELFGVAKGITIARANAPGFVEDHATLVVEVTRNLISIPLDLVIPWLDEESVPITIQPDPAPPGGILVTLTSDDPSVEILTPTVLIPEGRVVASGVAYGASPGSSTIKATNPLYAGHQGQATTTAKLDIVQTSLQIPEGFPQDVTVQLRAGGDLAAAPAGGIPFTLSPDDTTCVAQSSGHIPEGQTTTTVTLDYAGSADLPCTTTVTAHDTIVTPDTVTVTVKASTIVIYAPAAGSVDGFDIGAGLQDGSFSANLSASQHGGVTVTITSSDPSVALVSPDASTAGTPSVDVWVPDGQTYASFFTQGMEGTTGSVILTATAEGFVDDTIGVDIVQPGIQIYHHPTYHYSSLATSIDTLDPDDPFNLEVGAPSGTASVARPQAARSGGGGLTVTVSNTNPAVAELVTSTTTGQSVTVQIAEGSSSTAASVPAGGVAFSPLTAGSTVVSCSIPGFITTDNGTQTVNVTAPTISVGSPAAVGAGLQDSGYTNLSASQHGGVTVTITSSDPSVALVSPDASTAGTPSVDVWVPDGQTYASFFTQGMEGTTGSVILTATAEGFVDDTIGVDIVQPGIQIYHHPTYHYSSLATSIDTLDPDDPFNLEVGAPSGTASVARPQAARSGGGGLTVTVSNTNPAVAELVTSTTTGQSVTVQIAEGSSSTAASVPAGGVAFSPLTAGSTVVSCSIPGFITTDNGTQTVNVTAPTISVGSPAAVGAGLQDSGYTNLSASQHGGVTVTITSSDPSVALVSPDASTAGTPSVDVWVPDGQTYASFFTQGMEGTTGSVILTATAEGFVDDTIGVDIVQPGIQIYHHPTYHYSSLATSIDTLDPDDPFNLEVGAPSGTASVARPQAARSGGGGLTVTVSNTNPAVAELVTSTTTGQSVTVQIAEGSSSTAASVPAGGVAFSPLTAGSTVVSCSIPGFITTDNGTQTVNVTAPTISVGSPAAVGAGLQDSGYTNLSASQHGGVTVTITSSDPSVALVSPDASTAGTPSVDVWVPDGQTYASFFTQGMEGTTGSVILTATAEGFVDDTIGVDIVQPGIQIYHHPTYHYSSLATSIDTLDPDDPFNLEVGAPSGTASVARPQAARSGGGGLTVTVSNTNPAVAELVTSTTTGQSVTVQIAEGSSSTAASVPAGGVAFSPLTAGSTVVSCSIPGFITTDNGTQTVTVTEP